MRTFLIAGCIYLVLIATILFIRPLFMFTERGDWKEFGIGRNPATYTWMPFWLFAILSAMISYIVSVLIVRFAFNSSKQQNEEFIESIDNQATTVIEAKRQPSRRSKAVTSEADDLVPGYYMLNRTATEASGGIPKYVYLGPQLP